MLPIAGGFKKKCQNATFRFFSKDNCENTKMVITKFVLKQTTIYLRYTVLAMTLRQAHRDIERVRKALIALTHFVAVAVRTLLLMIVAIVV